MARLAKASVPYRYPVLGLEGGVPTWLGGSSWSAPLPRHSTGSIDKSNSGIPLWRQRGLSRITIPTRPTLPLPDDGFLGFFPTIQAYPTYTGSLLLRILLPRNAQTIWSSGIAKPILLLGMLINFLSSSPSLYYSFQSLFQLVNPNFWSLTN